jgi:hypothetical protein
MWCDVLARRPALFGLAVMLFYLALVSPMLARHHFDVSVFIVAGDRFVAAGQTPAPILVQRHSDGYDGQFYYRLALAPLLAQPTAFGVTLDHPAWRMQRILLPVLARLAAFGQPACIPAALFAVNLAALFAVGWLAMGMARALRFSRVAAWAIVAWPGFLVALSHDTTEILAAALLLGAVAAWLARRFALGAVLLALASLTRETAVLVACGLCAAAIFDIPRRRAAWHAAVCAGAAVLPFLAWRYYVARACGESAQAQGVAHNAGWPLLGVAQTVLADVLNRAVGLAHRRRDATTRLSELLAIGLFAWFGARTSVGLWRGGDAGLAVGWLLLLALMSMLTANGPLVDSTGFFRALTEWWVVGWVLLGVTRAAPQRPGWLVLALGPLLLRTWMLCWIQTKG